MTALGYIGLLVLAGLWALPMQGWLAADFPHHMLRHMGLVAVVAPLLVLGFPRLASVFAVSPLVGTVVEFAVVWGWHIPYLYGMAKLHVVGMAAEQASFLLAPRDLYASSYGGLADLTAQQLGGLLMLGIGTPVYLIAGLALVRQVLEQGKEAA